MAATLSTMAILNTKCLTMNTKSVPNLPKTSLKPATLLSIPTMSKTQSLASTAIAGAIFSTLGSCDAAFAVQQIADIADGISSDNRGLALLLPIVPALGWVLFNILQPALNQIDKMKSAKGVMVGLGLGGLGLMGMSAPEASADQIAVIGEAAAAAASADNRGTLLLFVITPAILWVLYNILQPALNQINKMKQ